MSSIAKYVIIFILSCLQIDSFAQVDIQKGLLACFSFEGAAIDVTGNRHDGVLKNVKLVPDRCGKDNSAYLFDINSEIELRNPASLATPQYSYALWAKSTRNPQSGEVLVLFSIGSPGGDQNMSNSNNSATNGPCIGWAGWGYNTNSNTSSFCLNTQGYAPVLNQWYHVVFTRDNKEKKLYIDGKLVNTSPSNDNAYYGSGVLKAKIGTRNANEGQHYFKGVIDDLRIYNRPLNADEVNALYSQQCQFVKLTFPASTCSNQNITFTANGVSKTYAPRYQWKVDDIAVAGKDSTLNYSFPSKSSDYTAKVTVTVAYQLGCNETFQSTDETMVSIRNCTGTNLKCNQPAKIQASDFYCIDNSVVFLAKGAEKSLFPTYQWQINDTNVGTQTTDSSFAQTFVPQSTVYSIKVGVLVNYQKGCSTASSPVRDEAIIDIKQCPGSNQTDVFYIPTMFTPNGDGINDTWELFNIASKHLDVFIYNRWGELVFYSNGYTVAWDGNRNGTRSPEGLYTYQIKSADGSVRTGSLMLTR
ncbi:LamG-like jellyroll fold domain-containing protein [Spirosoma aerophilum]